MENASLPGTDKWRGCNRRLMYWSRGTSFLACQPRGWILVVDKHKKLKPTREVGGIAHWSSEMAAETKLSWCTPRETWQLPYHIVVQPQITPTKPSSSKSPWGKGKKVHAPQPAHIHLTHLSARSWKAAERQNLCLQHILSTYLTSTPLLTHLRQATPSEEAFVGDMS